MERAAFLLREVFGYDYARVSEIVERSEANSRQLVTRARKHLEGGRPRFDADPEAGRALMERFLAAAEEGDLAALEEMLAADVVVYGDGGGKAQAARRPVVGAAKVARFLAKIAKLRQGIGEFGLELVTVNGQPGRVLRTPGGDVWDVMAVDVVEGRIQAVRIIRNPDKLAHL